MIWHSQAGQDKFVHDLIGDKGFFCDVGAHDGIVHSNTYALEQLGWTGICIEPNREVYRELEMNRRCDVWWGAASDGDKIVEFDGVRVGSGTFGIAALPLTTVLERVGAPTVIDFLSIDVEGHELEVLAGMDWDRWQVRLATIEHNLYCDGPARKDAIAAVMTGHGFECYADDIVAEGYGEYESWWIRGD